MDDSPNPRHGPKDEEFLQSKLGKAARKPPTAMDKKDHPGEGGVGNQNFRADPRREGLLTDRGDNK